MDATRWLVDSHHRYYIHPDQVRQRSAFRAWRLTALTVLALFLVQGELRAAATGRQTAAALSQEQTTELVLACGRLSLVVDVAMIAAYLWSGTRARRFVDSSGPGRRLRTITTGAFVVLCVGAVLDLWEDLVLALRLSERGAETAALTVSISDAAFQDGGTGSSFTVVMQIAVGLALVVLLGCVAAGAWRSGHQDQRLVSGSTSTLGDDEGSPNKELPTPEGDIICCSGGGIRAAAFAMGGLQALKSEGIYGGARAVVGVSGGGYTAAAFHVARWSPGRDPADDWKHPEPGRAFDLSSPETGWVRRHTRYLLGSFGTAVQGVLALLYGIAVNLVMIGIATILGSQVLGTLFAVSGRLGSPSGTVVALAEPAPGWWLLQHGWAVVATGAAAIFVATRVTEKWRTPSREARVIAEWTTAWLVRAAVLLLVLLVLLPWSIGQLHAPQPFGLDGSVARLLNSVVGIEYDAARPSSVGNAPTAGVVGLATLVSAVLAVIRSARTVEASGGPDDGGGSRVSQLLASAWARVRTVVVPWTGVVVIAMVLGAVLVRLTSAVVRDPVRPQGLWTLGVLVATFALARVVTDANRTSLHHFYRSRIALAFLVRRDGTLVRSIPTSRPLRFSQSAPGARKGPELVCCAVANVTDEELVPSDRGCVPFVFDAHHTGLTDRLLAPATSRRESSLYEAVADRKFRDATVPGVLAISGAAFSPMAGRENRRLRPYRVVLALANARLGVWLPNPLLVDATDASSVQAWRKPGLTRVVKEAFGKASIYDRFLYITDGGHYDNLGLVEALRRRPARVFVLDASNDAEDHFTALGTAIATARMDLDCAVSIDPREMRRLEKKRAPVAWCRGSVTYADGSTGELLVAKAVLTDASDWDVEAYAAAHPDFPRTSTVDQLYGELDFEAYRSLGQWGVERLMAHPDAAADGVAGGRPAEPDELRDESGADRRRMSLRERCALVRAAATGEQPEGHRVSTS